MAPLHAVPWQSRSSSQGNVNHKVQQSMCQPLTFVSRSLVSHLRCKTQQIVCLLLSNKSRRLILQAQKMLPRNPSTRGRLQDMSTLRALLGGSLQLSHSQVSSERL
jgi:hypothetical protein